MALPCHGRVSRAVDGPNPLAQFVIRPCPAEVLDVRVLVERGDPLGRELATEPARLLEHRDAQTGPTRRERGGDPAGPAADNEKIALLLGHPGGQGHGHDGDARVAGRGDPLDVEDLCHLPTIWGVR